MRPGGDPFPPGLFFFPQCVLFFAPTGGGKADRAFAIEITSQFI
jgi:hypothetical protein